MPGRPWRAAPPRAPPRLLRAPRPAWPDDRLLDQVDDLGEHAVRVGPATERVEALDDLSPALFRLRLDTGVPQRDQVLVGARDLDLTADEPAPEGPISMHGLVVDESERP